MFYYQRFNQYFAQVAGGLEQIAAKELKALGATDGEILTRGIHFTADRESLPPDRVHVVTLSQDGELSINGDAATLQSLPAELAVLRNGQPDLAVVIEADHRLTIQPVVAVMDALAEAGITKVALITQPE